MTAHCIALWLSTATGERRTHGNLTFSVRTAALSPAGGFEPAVAGDTQAPPGLDNVDRIGAPCPNAALHSLADCERGVLGGNQHNLRIVGHVGALCSL